MYQIARAGLVLACLASFAGESVAIDIQAEYGQAFFGRAAGPIRSGDFNNDGRLDYVTGRRVLLAQDSEGWEISTEIGNQDPIDVGVAHFDDDPYLDLVLLAAERGSNNGQLHYGLGDGTFAPGPVFPLPFGIADMAIGDLVGGGPPEMAIASSRSGGLHLFSLESGAFVERTFPVLGGAAELLVEDLDADGHLDVAVLGSSLSYYPGGTDALFALERFGDMRAETFLVEDLDNDGYEDIVLSSSAGTAGRTVVLPGLPGGGFGEQISPTSIFTMGGAIDLALADIDGDGQDDLVGLSEIGDLFYAVREQGLEFGRSRPIELPAVWDPLVRRALAFATGDWNGDSRHDVVLIDPESDSIHVIESKSVWVSFTMESPWTCS